MKLELMQHQRLGWALVHLNQLLEQSARSNFNKFLFD